MRAPFFRHSVVAYTQQQQEQRRCCRSIGSSSCAAQQFSVVGPAALQRGCVERHLSNRNEMRVSVSDSYALPRSCFKPSIFPLKIHWTPILRCRGEIWVMEFSTFGYSGRRERRLSY